MKNQTFGIEIEMKSQVYETVPKVQEIAKKLYFELQDK